MTKKGYFAASWGDIVNSPQWFSKFLKLSLLCFVPIFGIIVLLGYLFGWARDIAWNIHRPLPDKIFDNSDGNLYKRGVFVIVIAVVFLFVPACFSFFFNAFTGLFGLNSSHVVLGVGTFVSFIALCAGLFLSFLMKLFIYVGSIRCSLYATLSSGFQLNKNWSMIRYDLSGLVRILLMELAIGFVAVLVSLFIFSVGVSVTISLCQLIQNSFLSMVVVFVGLIVFSLISFFIFVFKETLILRALGYWVRQFDVPQWGGQEDLLPFEKGIQR